MQVSRVSRLTVAMRADMLQSAPTVQGAEMTSEKPYRAATGTQWRAGNYIDFRAE